MGMGVGPETREEVAIRGLDNLVPEGAGSGDWASRVPWKLGVLLSVPQGWETAVRIPYGRRLGTQPPKKRAAALWGRSREQPPGVPTD